MSEENNKDINKDMLNEETLNNDTKEENLNIDTKEVQMENKTNQSENPKKSKKSKKPFATVVVVSLVVAGICLSIGNKDNSGGLGTDELANEFLSDEIDPVYSIATNKFGEVLTRLETPNYRIVKQGDSNEVSQASRDRDSISIGVYKLLQDANPLTADASRDNDLLIIGAVFEGLAKYDEYGLIVPNLAKTIVESEDGKSITITLKDDLLFSDGTHVTTSEIISNYRIFMDPSIQSTYSNSLKVLKDSTDFSSGRSANFESVVANENGEITFYFETSSSENKKALLLPIQKTSLYSTYTYGKFMDGLYKLTNFKPVGTGPYKISSTTTSNATLSINENYYEEIPKVSIIEFEPMENSIAIDYLKRDLLDVYQFSYNKETLETLMASDNLSIYGVPAGNIDYLGFNFDSEIVSNNNIRKAVAYAIDRNLLLQEAYEGYGNVPVTMLNSSYYAVPNGVENYDYDVATAKKYIEEEGYKLNSDNLYEKDGELLTLTLYALDTLEISAVNIAEFLREVGIDINLELKSFSQLRNSISSEDKPFDMYMFTETMKNEYTAFERFLETRTNIENYKNTEANKILRLVKTEVDDEIRQNLLFKYIDIFNDDLPVLPLCEPYRFIAMSSNVSGVEPDVFTSFTSDINLWDK